MLPRLDEILYHDRGRSEGTQKFHDLHHRNIALRSDPDRPGRVRLDGRVRVEEVRIPEEKDTITAGQVRRFLSIELP